MKLLTYDDLKIETMRATHNPDSIIRVACDTTMMKDAIDKVTHGNIEQTIAFLIAADHTSVFEHVSYTFFITNVSRSFLAQITRHRMGSFTSASQHYQDYRDYPMIVSPEHRKPFAAEFLHDFYDESSEKQITPLELIVKEYVELIDSQEVPAQEARQVLPNAAAVDIMWTVNARSLINFFKHRMCNRNVYEMRHFANELHKIISIEWPNFAKHVGPDCIQLPEGCCQGPMKCKEEVWEVV